MKCVYQVGLFGLLLMLSLSALSVSRGWSSRSGRHDWAILFTFKRGVYLHRPAEDCFSWNGPKLFEWLWLAAAATCTSKGHSVAVPLSLCYCEALFCTSFFLVVQVNQTLDSLISQRNTYFASTTSTLNNFMWDFTDDHQFVLYVVWQLLKAKVIIVLWSFTDLLIFFCNLFGCPQILKLTASLDNDSWLLHLIPWLVDTNALDCGKPDYNLKRYLTTWE